jgi:general secretion pathway protein G
MKKSKLSVLLENKTGFTLIELLVSISIIAILTALLTANFVGARQRGRDGVRKADLRQMQSALELYRSDNGEYPLDSNFPACGSCLSESGTCDPSDVKYMQEVPCDPSSDSSSYTYVSTDGSTYTVYACIENEQDSEICSDPDCSSVCGSGTYPFKVTNP